MKRKSNIIGKPTINRLYIIEWSLLTHLIAPLEFLVEYQVDPVNDKFFNLSSYCRYNERTHHKYTCVIDKCHTLKGSGFTSLAWNLERRGGSNGFPRYLGTGNPNAITRKSSDTRTNFHESNSSLL